MIDPSTFSSPIKQGDLPLSDAQLARKLEKALDRVVSRLDRMQIVTTQFTTAEQIGIAGAQVEAVAMQINVFNRSLAVYQTAVFRLDRARLADEHPATVETPMFDLDTGEPTGVADFPNPLIVADDAERAEAQAVIDATPIDVKLFAL